MEMIMKRFVSVDDGNVGCCTSVLYKVAGSVRDRSGLPALKQAGSAGLCS